MGAQPSRMVWPPKIKSMEPLGEVVDINGRKLPRDGGRAVKIGKHMYYVFGDTFCFDDNGQFVAFPNNTLAWIPDRHKPLESSYLTSDPKVPPFIPLTEEEEKFDKDHKAESKRFITWCFGGLIEDEDGCGKGWMWFEKCEGTGGNISRSDGVRVCRVENTGDHYVKAERILPDERIFPDGEPQFGNIACVRDGDYVYMVSGHGLENVLARARHDADFTKRSEYQFWCKGDQWQDDFKNVDELQPLLGWLGQGQIVATPGCGPGGKRLMLFCNEKWPTGFIFMGWADKVEGPWDVVKIGEAPKHWPNSTKSRYAMFPHTWCYDWNEGEMLMTYSDDGQMGGAVLGMKLTFEVERPPES